MQRRKKYFFILLALTAIVLYFKFRDKPAIENTSAEKKSSPFSGRKIANSIHSALTPTPDHTSNTDINLNAKDYVVEQNDPIREVLKDYDVDESNSIAVNYDRWFVSEKYIQIHTSEFDKGSAKEKSKHNNFYIVEHNQHLPKSEYPPLVISHATNQPIPLTGNIFVKFLESAQMHETIDFLKHDSELDEIISEVSVNPVLVEVNRLLIKPKKRGQVLILYQRLLQHVGSHNIEAVEPDTHYQFRI
jgi:hypothetical protein